MGNHKRLNRKRALQRVDEQLALLDRWYTTIATDEVGYDPQLVGDVATKLLSDLALVVMLRNDLRHRRRQLLQWSAEELELVDIPNDPLLLGTLLQDEAAWEELTTTAKAQHRTVPEQLLKRLHHARAKEAAGR